MAKINGILIGAAIGTLLGSIAVALYPKRNEILKNLEGQTNFLSGKALEAAKYIREQTRNNPFHAKEEPKGNFLVGSLLGLISGAGAALFLTPTSGRSLRNQIIKAYNEMADRSHEIVNVIHKNSVSPKKLKRKVETFVKKKTMSSHGHSHKKH